MFVDSSASRQNPNCSFTVFNIKVRQEVSTQANVYTFQTKSALCLLQDCSRELQDRLFELQ